MNNKVHAFELDFLDHVAIRVSNPEASAGWYASVLGLKRLVVPEWGDIPIFMISGKTGVAIFPSKSALHKSGAAAKSIAIDHFAFRVDRENFEKAKKHYEDLGLPYTIQDHVYFLSLYTCDPDGHTVELTTPVKVLPLSDEKEK